MAAVTITNQRRTTQQYNADLALDGEVVGRVERGWSQGGAYENDYQAKVGVVMVSHARSLAALRSELNDPEFVAEIRSLVEDMREEETPDV